LRKKENLSKTEEAALQNESVVVNAAEETVAEETVAEEKQSDFKISSFDDENRKSGVYIDKEEAEAFLEAQRKKKLRNKIITTVVSVVAVLLIVFIVYNVVFGGNAGFIKFPGFAVTRNDSMAAGEIVPNTDSEKLYGTAQNEDGTKTELWFSPADSLITIKIIDKNGEVIDSFRSWPAPLDDEAAPLGEGELYAKYSNESNHQIISSLVSVTYSTSNLDGGKSFAINSIEHEKEIKTINNGFRVKFTVSEAGCSFVVEYYLDSNGEFVVNVPRNELYEPDFDAAFKDADDETDKEPRLASVTCLPFFGATRQGDEGYFVLPDGSGALTYFDESRITNYSEYKKRVYGVDETFDLSDTAKPNLNSEYIALPVYGIVGKNTAVTCYAEKGETAAYVVVGMPGVKNLSYYYINFSFNWREYYYSKLSNGGASYKFLEVPASGGDFTQRYNFKNSAVDNELTYVDVAEQNREFLLREWKTDESVYEYLKGAVNAIGADEDSAELLNIKLFLAAVNESSVSLFSEVKVMTTFGDAKDIITDIKAGGADKVRYSLLGWQNDGYYGNITKRFKVERDLGGKNGLKELNEWAAGEGIELAGDQNMLLVYGKPKGGGNLRNSVVKTPGYEYLKYKMVSNAGTFIQNTEFYYMSPLYYDTDMLKDDIKGLNKLEFENVDLQQLGDLVYTDYNKEHPMLRQQAIEYYRKWIVEYKKNFNEASVYYGFGYSASVADSILDIPTESSSVFEVDATIPFLQIVYHGLVDYYSEPINRTTDNVYSTLKAVEYGSFLTYEVTENLTEELKYTKYNSLFKSCYTDLKGQILEGYEVAKLALEGVQDATITKHYCVDSEKNGNVYCTEYSNGVKVYVNYGASEYAVDEGNVPSSGFGVVSADGFKTMTIEC